MFANRFEALKQTIENWELIIIDNYSVDNTSDIFFRNMFCKN